MAKVPHEFKPGEALTAAGLNDVQSQILDQLDAAKAAATARGDQLQAAIDQNAKTAAANLQTAQTTLQQAIDQTAKTAAASLQSAQTALQQKIDGVQAGVNAVQQKEDAAIAAINQQLGTFVQKSPEISRLLRMLSPIGARQILAMKPGGLPLEASFDTSGGMAILFVAGAANKFSGDYTLAMRVLVDGVGYGDYKVATNEDNSHKALVTAPIPLPGLAAGRHTVRLENLGGNVSTDFNDFFDVSVLELPPLTHLPTRRYFTGALPQETTIETHGGAVLAFVSGSGFHPLGGTIGMFLSVDGVRYGNGVMAFTNEKFSHKAFSPATVPLPIGAGLHRVRLEYFPGTQADANDYFGITFVELPLVAPTRAQQIFQMQPGKLPLKAPFQTRGGTVMLFVSGSGWNSSAEKQIGMNIFIDQKQRGSCMRYTNEANSHKVFVQATLVLTDLAAGEHSLALDVQPGTNTDGNDYFDATLLEIMV